jgi:hypothetical protein
MVGRHEISIYLKNPGLDEPILAWQFIALISADYGGVEPSRFAGNDNEASTRTIRKRASIDDARFGKSCHLARPERYCAPIRMNPRNFFAELERRNVHPVAVVNAVVGRRMNGA